MEKGSPERYNFHAGLAEPAQKAHSGEPNDHLSLQMRRASLSIPANIAEGFRRRGKPDKARFMNIAEGSVEECRYFLILANDLGYGDTQKLSATLEEVSRLLGAYAAAILASDS